MASCYLEQDLSRILALLERLGTLWPMHATTLDSSEDLVREAIDCSPDHAALVRWKAWGLAWQSPVPREACVHHHAQKAWAVSQSIEGQRALQALTHEPSSPVSLLAWTIPGIPSCARAGLADWFKEREPSASTNVHHGASIAHPSVAFTERLQGWLLNIAALQTHRSPLASNPGTLDAGTPMLTVAGLQAVWDTVLHAVRGGEHRLSATTSWVNVNGQTEQALLWKALWWPVSQRLQASTVDAWQRLLLDDVTALTTWGADVVREGLRASVAWPEHLGRIDEVWESERWIALLKPWIQNGLPLPPQEAFRTLIPENVTKHGVRQEVWTTVWWSLATHEQIVAEQRQLRSLAPLSVQGLDEQGLTNRHLKERARL